MYDSLYRNVPKTSEEQKLNILNRNLEIWVFFSRTMVSIVVIDRKNKLSKRCVDNNNSQRIIHFCPFYTVLHCLVRPCVRWSLTGGWKQYKILKLSAEKVVAVAYGRWWFMRGSSIRFWLRIFLVFWKGGGLYGRWSYVEVWLYFFPIYYLFDRLVIPLTCISANS